MLADVVARNPDTPSRPDADGPVVVLLVVGLFVTGACGLVYQQLWLRQLSLVFGVTVFAAATAVAVFMAGLALGAHLAGRWADRTSRPLQWYGASEIAVGLLAVATPAAMLVTERAYVGLSGILPDDLVVVTAVRLALAFAVLIVPATLMGASTPLVVKAASQRSGRVGQRTGLLYATNTMGAIVGTLVAGFWLIGEVGIQRSFVVAAIGNLVVGLLTVLASRMWFERRSRPVASPAQESTPPAAQADRRIVLWVFFVSGFAALGLEIVWFRALSLYLESTTYAFSAMLAVVLVGIAVGSFAVTPFLGRPWPWLRILAGVELLVGLAALLSFATLSRGYDVVDALAGPLGLVTGGERETFVFAALAILPSSVLLGVAFPIGVRLWAEGDEHSGEAVGRFYALNVLGGIAGSLTAGFVLLPLLGLRASLVLLAGLLVVSGLVLLRRAGVRFPGVAAVAVAWVVLALVAVPSPWAAVLEHRFPGARLVLDAEGVQSNVAVTQTTDGVRTMYIDGLPQASNIPLIVRGHEQIGLLPAVLHPDPRRALVVGLGGGVTTGAVASVPGLAVEVVELSGEVVEGARRFADVNGGAVDRDNVTIRVDDGRNFLLTSGERYDVITADIIQPRSPGAGKLWSKEYWELVRDALAPGGVMLQWVGSGRTVVEYDLVVRTFLEVFPHATLWSNGDLLVGTNEPLVLDRAAFEARFGSPEGAALLARLGVGGFDDLLDRYTAGSEQLRAFVGPGPTLTDDLPRIEYWRSLHLPEGTPGPDIAGLEASADPRELLRGPAGG